MTNRTKQPNEEDVDATTQDEVRVIRTPSGNRVNVFHRRGEEATGGPAPDRRERERRKPKPRTSAKAKEDPTPPVELESEGAPRVVRTATGNRVNAYAGLAEELERRSLEDRRRRDRRAKRGNAISLLIVGVLLIGTVAVALRARANWVERVELVHEVGARSLSRDDLTPTPVSAPAPTPADRARLEWSDAGELVQVSGASPEAVAVAYCRSSEICDSRQPLEIAATLDQQLGVKVAVFRDSTDRFRSLAIEIRRDRPGVWVAGDGEQSIGAQELDRVPVHPDRVTVDNR